MSLFFLPPSPSLTLVDVTSD
jgi:hypothetical protein